MPTEITSHDLLLNSASWLFLRGSQDHEDLEFAVLADATKLASPAKARGIEISTRNVV